MSKQSFFTALVRSQCRVAMLLGLILVLATEIGCANTRYDPTARLVPWSSASFWRRVPPVRWTGRDRVTETADASEPVVAEAAVVANVAIPAEAVNEPQSESASASRSSSMRSSKRIGRIERPLDGSTFFDVTDSTSADSDSGSLTEIQQTNSSMERLHAALSDDSFQEAELLQGSLTTLDLRVRVESLLARAKQLVDVGQLELARDTAQMAQDVVESSQLDYSPDEERPIDLVRRIDGQLEAIRLTDDLQVGVQSSASSIAPADANATAPAKAGEKEGKGLSRIRREITTIFRREKKPASKEPETAVVQKVAATPSTAPPTVKPTATRKEAVQAVASSSNEAVVMANRSVSLGSNEAQLKSSVSVDSDFGHASLSKGSLGATESSTWQESELATDDEQSDSGVGTVVHDRESDEPNSVPPEFDVVDPVRPNHELASTIDEQPLVEVVELEEEPSSDWTTFYLIVAGCSLLAFGCYRRGAT